MTIQQNMLACMYAYMYVYMYIRTYICMRVCTHICMHACMCTHMCLYSVLLSAQVNKARVFVLRMPLHVLASKEEVDLIIKYFRTQEHDADDHDHDEDGGPEVVVAKSMMSRGR